MVTNSIQIEVAYACPEKQLILSLSVSSGSTIESAIHQSNILLLFPEIDLKKQTVGVFGRQRQLNDEIKANERIEIYRPLIRDPKETRRLRAKNSPNLIVGI